jgi:Tfp pilus assembly protein PilF
MINQLLLPRITKGIPAIRFFVIIFLLGTEVPAQNQSRIDSLQRHLENADGPTKSEIYGELGRAYYAYDFERALYFFNKALDTGPGSDKDLARAYRRKAHVLINLKHFAEAEAILTRITPLAIVVGGEEELGRIANLFGCIYLSQGNYAAALRSFTNAAFHFEKAGFTEGFSILYGNIGLIHYKLLDFQRAIEYSLRALNHSPVSAIQTMIHNNLALCYIRIGELELAKEHINLSVETCKHDDCRIQTDFTRGVLLAEESSNEASQIHRRSLVLAQNVCDYRMVADNLVVLGYLYGKDKCYDSALVMYQKAAEVARENGFLHVEEQAVAPQLEILERRGDFRQINLVQERFVRIYDEVRSSELPRELALAEIKLEENLNRQLLAAQSHRIALQDSVQYYQTTILFVIGFIIGLLFLLSASLVFSMHQKSRSKRILAHLVESRKTKLLEKRVCLTESVKLQYKEFDRLKKLVDVAASKATVGLELTSGNST